MLILSIFLLSTIIISSRNSSAISVDIKVNFDQNEYEVYHNGSLLNVTIHGRLSCVISENLEDYQYVTVYLRADDQYSWDPGVAPSQVIFYSSGKQPINVSFTVEPGTFNNTINDINVNGRYQIEPSYKGDKRSRGDICGDSFNVKLIRTYPLEDIDPSFDPSYDQLNLLEGRLSFILLGLIILIPIIVIIVYFKKIRP